MSSEKYNITDFYDAPGHMTRAMYVAQTGHSNINVDRYFDIQLGVFYSYSHVHAGYWDFTLLYYEVVSKVLCDVCEHFTLPLLKLSNLLLKPLPLYLQMVDVK